MDTCFLFTKTLDVNGCCCLKLSQDGRLISAPTQLNFAQIKELQKECKTIVVESSESTCLFELDLAWLPERKARVAIPYALEDRLAQTLDDVHFAFDKQRYQNKCYLITVISKERMHFIMNELDEHGIEFKLLTTDWFALSPQEVVCTRNALLINSDDFKGVLFGDMALDYLKNHPLVQPLLFKDSELNPDSSQAKQEEHSYVWLAKRLQKSKPLNLCQGDIQKGTHSGWIRKGYLLAGILCCVWLLSMLLVNGLSLYFINKKTSDIDKQIATIYQRFFPEAKQVINPKFRISQLLGANQSDAQAHFWFLLNQFAKGMQGSPLIIEQMRYQNKTLFVTLLGADFPKMEVLENKLKEAQLKVKQTQASTRDKQVVATLELT